MRVEIGLARRSDACEIAGLSVRSFDAPWSETAIACELARTRCRASVARDGAGELAGYAIGARVLDELDLFSVAVEPRIRRRGVGRSLLEAYIEMFREDGVRQVYLEVRVSNQAAQALYGALGFTQRGVRPRYYLGGEAALLYGLAA